MRGKESKDMTKGTDLMKKYNAMTEAERKGKEGREVFDLIKTIQARPLAKVTDRHGDTPLGRIMC